MAIVLPDAILGAPGLEYVRQWILNHCRLVASIDLHPDTFQPRNGTQTSVLILQKKSANELSVNSKSPVEGNYQIFMAQTKAIGHDKRGNTLYRRNDDGEELLFLHDHQIVEQARGGLVGKTELLVAPQKVVDDDTPQIAREFLRWKNETVLGW